MAALSASTALANSTSAPSPVSLTRRPPYFVRTGSRCSERFFAGAPASRSHRAPSGGSSRQRLRQRLPPVCAAHAPTAFPWVVTESVGVLCLPGNRPKTSIDATWTCELRRELQTWTRTLAQHGRGRGARSLPPAPPGNTGGALARLVKNRLHEISHAAQDAGQFGPAVRAEELLGKSVGMFIDRSLQLTDQLNDSHITALLELARKRQAEPIDLKDDGEDGEGHGTRDDD